MTPEITELGQYQTELHPFPKLDKTLEHFQSNGFKKITSIERNHTVNAELLKLIQNEEGDDFLLGKVLHFLNQISEQRILDGNYNLTAFERWLNQHSDLSQEARLHIRGKIAGKYIPRYEYQAYFPITHDKYYPNTHIVTAHNPPDLDSTSGSFVGWLDAFACQVGTTLTVWNVPGGTPGPMITQLFDSIYGDKLFERIAKGKTTISPVAMDLVEQNQFLRFKGDSNIRDFAHNRNENHIVLVDDDGYYLGDWRVSDVDSVGRVQRFLNIAVHSCEKLIVSDFAHLLSKTVLHKSELEDFINNFLNRTIVDSAIQAKDYYEHEHNILDSYLKKVLDFPLGLETRFEDFFIQMDKISDTTFQDFLEVFKGILKEDFYNEDSLFTASRCQVFRIFNESFLLLANSIISGRKYYDRMDIAVAIKQKVLDLQPNYVTTKADITEIKEKLKGYQHLTVIFIDKEGRYIPVGAIHRDNIENNRFLSTVTVRDFCNTDEIKLSPSVEIISAIDHHRSEIKSQQCMTINIADVQSVNVILAELAFKINDKYGLRGQSLESVQAQIEEEMSKDQPCFKLLQRLYKKLQAHKNCQGKFFISPQREFTEYLIFLNAIVDDTDLFAKCGWRDIDAVEETVNRAKSILLKKEVNVLNFDDLERNQEDLKIAIQRCLINPDIQSFYLKIFQYRQKLLNDWLANNKLHTYCFEDRKTQKEVCSISQTKYFQGNQEVLQQNRQELTKSWLKLNRIQNNKNGSLIFFIHMLSTITDDTCALDTSFNDELWISIPRNNELSESLLRQFLYAIQDYDKFQKSLLGIDIFAHKKSILKTIKYIFKKMNLNNIPMSENIHDKDEIIIVLKIKQSSMNSRKADITPFLPNT